MEVKAVYLYRMMWGVRGVVRFPPWAPLSGPIQSPLPFFHLLGCCPPPPGPWAPHRSEPPTTGSFGFLCRAIGELPRSYAPPAASVRKLLAELVGHLGTIRLGMPANSSAHFVSMPSSKFCIWLWSWVIAVDDNFCVAAVFMVGWLGWSCNVVFPRSEVTTWWWRLTTCIDCPICPVGQEVSGL